MNIWEQIVPIILIIFNIPGFSSAVFNSSCIVSTAPFHSLLFSPLVRFKIIFKKPQENIVSQIELVLMIIFYKLQENIVLQIELIIHGSIVF